jgi:hypothetical protein
VDYILIIIFIGLVIAAVTQFSTPTIGDEDFYYYSCYSMGQGEYEESIGAITDLISGGVPNTTSLIHIFLTEGPPRYFGTKFKSLAAEEETGDFCNNHTRNVYLLLKAAYEYALEGRNSTARDYLDQAEFVWESP